jgi:rubrerythrin
MSDVTERESEAPRESAMHDLARDDSSRKRFLKMMGGGGAAAAFSVFLAACGEEEQPKQGGQQTGQQGGGGGMKGDLEILQYALTLEHLETDFYNAVIKAGVIKDKSLAKVATSIRDNEQEHVDALHQTIRQMGGNPQKPQTTFQSVIRGGPKKVLQTAATVENLGAAAYLGQAGRIKSKEVLAAALSIHSVEARHAAALNRVVGKSFVPEGAFAKPATMEEVLPQVKPFLKQ